MMVKSDFDLDSLLNPEQDFYSKGYNEGLNDSTREEYLEGRAYGLQTGFQRFLLIGIMKGYADKINEKLNSNDITNSKVLSMHLSDLEKYLDSFSLDNEESSVLQYEKLLIKCKNKMRNILRLTKAEYTMEDIEKVINNVGGDMHLSQNVDEMW